MPGDLQAILSEMHEFMRNLSNVGAEETTLANEFLKTSRDDLRASEIMYEKGLYALAVYHLQQAVEKATKTYCLAFGMATAAETKRIGHDSLKGHLIYAKKLSRFIPEFGQIDPRCNVDLARADELERRRLEIARFDGATIDEILSAFDVVDRSFDVQVPQLVNWMRLMVAGMIKEEPRSEESKSNANNVSRRIEEAIPLIRTVPFLFVASVLTFPHEEFTRYPDKEIKPWDYGMSMGIVARMPTLIVRVEKSLQSMETLLKQILK